MIKSVFIERIFPRQGKIRRVIRKIKNVVKTNNVEDYTISEKSYQNWIKNNEPTKEEIDFQAKNKFTHNPKISIVLAINNLQISLFSKLIESINNQTYKNWQLCLIISGSIKEKSELEKIINKESKIKFIFLEDRKDIVDLKNIALDFVDGEYICFVEQECILSIFALYELVSCINKNPDVKLIYCDEDFIEKDIRKHPYFKPDFAPDTLRTSNYIGDFCVFEKEILQKVGKIEYESNYDIILKVTESTNNVLHIPKILYHKNCNNIVLNEVEIVQNHIKRIGLDGTVKKDKLGFNEIEYKLKEYPKVSILIPNKDSVNTLRKCINSILSKTTYSNYEIIVIENNSTKASIFKYYKKINENSKCRVIEYKDSGFNYSKIINYGVKNSDGEYIVQLNNDTELITPNWLEEMLMYAQRKDVGAVGVELFYPDKTIQHAGIIVGMGGIAGHVLKNIPQNQHGYFFKDVMVQNLSAVTAACMMGSRKTYNEVKSMNEDLKVAFNDVDFCLKIRQKGKLIVYNPKVKLWHYESKTRGLEDTIKKQQRFANEIEVFKSQWKDFLAKGDPYYNINLKLDSDGYQLKEEKIERNEYE